MRLRKLLIGTSWLTAAILIGPLAWALISAILTVTNNAGEDRSATGLLDEYSAREPIVSYTLGPFDPHVYNPEIVARDCGVPWDRLRGLSFDAPAYDASPAGGWWRIVSDGIRTSADEYRSRDVRSIERQTSKFERVFLSQCIVASAAQPLCRSRVRHLMERRFDDDEREKTYYAAARASYHRLSCAYLRDLANAPVSTR